MQIEQKKLQELIPLLKEALMAKDKFLVGPWVSKFKILSKRFEDEEKKGATAEVCKKISKPLEEINKILPKITVFLFNQHGKASDSMEDVIKTDALELASNWKKFLKLSKITIKLLSVIEDDKFKRYIQIASDALKKASEQDKITSFIEKYNETLNPVKKDFKKIVDYINNNN